MAFKASAFDPDKDETIKSWTSEETGLQVSIARYDGGEAKIQIGPRVYVKKDGSTSQRKAGRLTLEDLEWFYTVIDEIKEELAALVPPR
ncbi:MAG: hypothetical protein HZB23_11335 [Deltaproteobacteria bacterium]|nr:hypothetical protein [Deltaproteobacteria bacterium]